jgi:serine/threonine protein kinase
VVADLGQLSEPLRLTAESSTVYEIGEIIGQGTSARVFRATGPAPANFAVAIKRMLRRDDETVLVAQREFNLLRQLHHPAVISVVDFGVDQDQAWIAMEMFESETLTASVKKSGPFDESATVSVMRHLSSAVSYLYANGVCHRDLKPDNVLISTSATDGRSPRCEALRLIDFNVAARVEPSSTCLSPVGQEPFIAPEVRREEEYSLPVDVWGMGAIAYYLLAGAFPAHGMRRGILAMDSYVSADPSPELFLEGFWKSVNQAFYALLRLALSLDPLVRPTAQAFQDTLNSTFPCADDSLLCRDLVVIPESAPNSPGEVKLTPVPSPE